MIDEESILGSFNLPITCERSIQAVAKLIDYESKTGQPEKCAVEIRQQVADDDD